MRSRCCYYLFLLLMGFFSPFPSLALLSFQVLESTLSLYMVSLHISLPAALFISGTGHLLILFVLCVLFLNFWTLNLTLSFLPVKTKKLHHN